MLNEIPDNIEEVFAPLGLHLLPRGTDLTTDCSCPDWSNPCKHIAGVYYLVAAELDQDPFRLFELRGLSKAVLQAELATAQPAEPGAVESFFTRPESIAPDSIFHWRDGRGVSTGAIEKSRSVLVLCQLWLLYFFG